MGYPKKVKIIEVGPRDGLQNQSKIVASEDKIKFINMLNQCGYKSIEVTSFVSPKWIPQMGDNKVVYQGIEKHSGIHYPVLVPNEKGIDAALAVGVKEIALFTAASDAFTQKNINCTVDESFKNFEPVVKKALDHGLMIRGYVSTAITCPYAGDISPQSVATVAKRLLDLGCYEISLGDTIGVGTPDKIKRMLEAVLKQVSAENLAGHYHDTYSQALSNIYASLEMGIAAFDSSVSGLGGCPYAKGASGNVATEDVLYLLNGINIETGIDLDKVIDAACFIDKCLERAHGSKVTLAILNKR